MNEKQQANQNAIRLSMMADGLEHVAWDILRKELHRNTNKAKYDISVDVVPFGMTDDDTASLELRVNGDPVVGATYKCDDNGNWTTELERSTMVFPDRLVDLLLWFITR